MNTVVKWIRQRQHFSSPLFALLLMVNVFILPSYRAAAQIEEPVQPMAQTAEQVIDALNAVEAGASVDQAFGIQPVPYRDTVKIQKTIYETLFGVAYDVDDAYYTLDNEVVLLDEANTVSGHMADGREYQVRFSMLGWYDYINDSAISNSDANDLAEANTSILCFAGTLSTDYGAISVLGAIFQIDTDAGVRDRGLVFFEIVSAQVIEDLDYVNQLLLQTEVPVVPQNCEDAFRIARNNYLADLEIAKNELEECMILAIGTFVGAMGGCAGLAIKAGVAAAATGGLIAPVAAVGVVWCSLAALGAASGLSGACALSYQTKANNARVRLNTARANARILFGVENCPGDPV
ncbi:MAG: hypothetical protein CMJ25_26090 [Phycisphaerae bacterium]|nr:hypothetical protein [Phycisphaerae bacterium]